jgi:serine/threonine protein phosphatase PrpC
LEVQSKTPEQGAAGVAVAEHGPLELQAIACSDPGRKRSNNEDNYLVLDVSRGQTYEKEKEVRVDIQSAKMLLAVADGMGGHRSGEVASRTCVENLSKAIMKALSNGQAAESDHRKALVESVEQTNRVIYEMSGQNPQYEGMGTTLTAVLLIGTRALIAQVGDSRAYLLRGKTMTQLTRDQTVGNSLLELQPNAVINENLSSMLSQAVGIEDHVEVAVTNTDLEPGDILLLCSDGLTKTVKNDEVSQIGQHHAGIRAKAETLIARANENGGPDNVTVVMSEVRKRN